MAEKATGASESEAAMKDQSSAGTAARPIDGHQKRRE
jgi:hypothetical protein